MRPLATHFLASLALYPKAIVHASNYPLLQLKPILLICKFHICKFAYSKKFIGNPQINTWAFWWSLWACTHTEW